MPFVEVVDNVFVLIFGAPLPENRVPLQGTLIVQGRHETVEIVARMVEIVAAAQGFALHGIALTVVRNLTQPIIALYIEILAFDGIEKTCRQTVLLFLRGLMRPAESPEVGGEAV